MLPPSLRGDFPVKKDRGRNFTCHCTSRDVSSRPLPFCMLMSHTGSTNDANRTLHHSVSTNMQKQRSKNRAATFCNSNTITWGTAHGRKVATKTVISDQTTHIANLWLPACASVTLQPRPRQFLEGNSSKLTIQCCIGRALVGST